MKFEAIKYFNLILDFIIFFVNVYIIVIFKNSAMPPIIQIYTNPGNDGFWGNITSTVDWCEENYVVNYYIAEFCKLTLNHDLTS